MENFFYVMESDIINLIVGGDGVKDGNQSMWFQGLILGAKLPGFISGLPLYSSITNWEDTLSLWVSWLIKPLWRLNELLIMKCWGNAQHRGSIQNKLSCYCQCSNKGSEH